MDLGNGVEIDLAKIDFSQASDEELRAVRERIEAFGEARGLWVPEGAGQLAVAEAVAVPVGLRGQILANAEADVAHTNRVFDIINGFRYKEGRSKYRFDITPAGEQREKLEDQLTDRALEATKHLYITKDRPLMVVPALPDAITAEELIAAISKSSKYGVPYWAGRRPFLAKFPINALTGYDAERAESGAMTLIETGYDASRQGTWKQQLAKLQAIQEEFPEVGTAPILATASLGQRYGGQPDTSQDTYTRAIEVDPKRHDGFDCVVSAGVRENGYSGVRNSCVQRESVSRRQVELNA